MSLVGDGRGSAPVPSALAPVAGDGAQIPAPAPRVGPLRRFWRTVQDYRLLRATPYGIKPALVIGFIILLGSFDTAGFRITGPVIARELEIQITDVIEIQVIVATAAVLATIVVGWLADRTRRVPYLAFGTLGAGFFAALLSRAHSFTTVAAPRVFNDVATAAATVPEFSLVADYYPPDSRGRVFSLLGTLSRIGRVVAIPATGALLAAFGFRTSYLIIGAPLALMGLVALAVLREPVRGYMERKALGADEEVARREEEPQSLAESWRTTFGSRTIRRLVVAASFGGVADEMVGLFFPFFLFDVYGLDVFETSLALLPAALAGLVGGILGGGLIDRFTARNPARVLSVFALYSTVASTGVLVYVFRPPLLVLVAANAAFSFGSALLGPARSVVLANVIPPKIRTAGLQMTGLSALPGLLLAGTLGGSLFSLYGFGAVFLFAFPFLLVDGLISLSAAAFYDLDMRSAMAAAIADEEWRRAKLEGRGKLLVCRDVDVEYDGVQVLFGVNLDIEEGEIVALLGTNGAGKSTLLRAITGVRQASGGAVVFDGRDVTHMPPHEIAARGVIHMPGGRGVFPDMSVADNLELACWLLPDAVEARSRLQEVLEIFPRLRERADVPAGLLSGGEQQMLSLALAFLAKPRLLLIDELSLGLSPTVVRQLVDRLREIHRRGVTILIVEQSVGVALEIAEKAVFMEKGQVRFSGKTRDLLERPDLLRAVYVRGTAALGGGTAARDARRQRRESGGRPVLEVRNLVKSYGGIRAVDGVSFELAEGTVLGLIGPNGAGKTTVFDLISGFQPADEGSVILEGVDVTSWRPEERARAGLIRRFQDAGLFGALTVEETLLVALEDRAEVRATVLHALSAPQARRSERRLRAQADRLLELLELGPHRDKLVRELSTGLRRIVDLACVLATEPRVLLLDEPSTGIAQAETENLVPLLRRAKSETGCSMLVIEHDMALISNLADELLALDQGAVLVRGAPDQVLEDERVIESYLGGRDPVR